MTKADKVRKFLESYLKLKQDYDKTIELYARLYSTATSINIYYGGTRGGDPGNIVENSVIQLDAVMDRLVDKKQRLLKKERTIRKLCKHLKSEKTRQIILRTYLYGATRAEIADDLNCTMQSVTNHRTRGIEELVNYIRWNK